MVKRDQLKGANIMFREVLYLLAHNSLSGPIPSYPRAEFDTIVGIGYFLQQSTWRSANKGRHSRYLTN
jgi:hypothetical protein